MATMICSNCGAEMPEDTVVCTRCGILVDQKKRNEKKQPVPEVRAVRPPVHETMETVRNRTETQPVRPQAGRTQEGGVRKDTSGMRRLQAISAELVNRTEDNGLKTVLRKLAEDFRISDPVSTDATEPLETGLLARITDLRKTLAEGDREAAEALCAGLSDSLKERNRVCARSK